jgi:hypothetical protein
MMQNMTARLHPLLSPSAVLSRAAPLALRTAIIGRPAPLSTTSRLAAPSNSQSNGAPQIPDQLAEGDAKGVTGGGEPLESSDRFAPPPPKVENAKIRAGQKLTEEQQKEVDQHNRDFEKKHDRAGSAAKDKVDEDFWGGSGTKG